MAFTLPLMDSRAQVVNTLLVSAVAGITLSVAKQLVVSPVGIISLLSSTVPNQSSFFMTYIVLQVTENLTHTFTPSTSGLTLLKNT